MSPPRTRNPKPPEEIKDFRMILRQQAIKEFGDDKALNFDQFMDQIKGVHLYRNLPMQFLLGMDVVPLGRVMSIVGEWGSSKSSLGWYLSTLYTRVGGMLCFIETERKSNPDQFKGLVGSYIDIAKGVEWFLWNPASSLDTMLGYIRWYVDNILKSGGFALNRPFLIMADSLAAPSSEKEQLDMDQGGESKGFQDARNAAMIKDTFQDIVDPLAMSPTTCAIINHQKVKVEQQGHGGQASHGPPKKHETGGGHQHYAYTYLLQLTKIGKKTLASGTYPMIKIEPKKTSMSDQYRNIEVPYKSLWTGKDGEEQIWYDWDTALMQLLMNESLFKPDTLRAVVDIKKAGAFYSSDALGVKSLTAQQMGRLIHNTPELVKNLQDKVLRIRRKPHYGTVIDGIDQSGPGQELCPEGEGDSTGDQDPAALPDNP